MNPPFPELSDIATVHLKPISKSYPLLGFGGIPLYTPYILGNQYDIAHHTAQDYKCAKWLYEHSNDITVSWTLND